MPSQLSVKQTADRFIDYRRSFQIPRLSADQTTMLKFLSVNDGAQVLINDQLAGKVDYGLFRSALDISRFALPGDQVPLTGQLHGNPHAST